MKQNKTILTFIEKEFNKINIKYDILQLRKRKGNKFYWGYIYIYDMIDLTDEQKQIIKSTEEWLDERWVIANMEINKDNPYSADMQYYKGAIATVEWLGYDWKREDGKHKLFK